MNVHNGVMSKILYIITPTNWDELSGEEKGEFEKRFFSEYFRLYEERIGPFPGTPSRASRLQRDNQAGDTAARRRTRPDVSRRDPQK